MEPQHSPGRRHLHGVLHGLLSGARADYAGHQPRARRRVCRQARPRCGLSGGYFSVECALQGAEVVGVDHRVINVKKCEFVKSVLGVETASFNLDDALHLTRSRYGEFDVVLTLGLLYHLDDPFTFVSNVAELCDRFAVIDSLIALPGGIVAGTSSTMGRGVPICTFVNENVCWMTCCTGCVQTRESRRSSGRNSYDRLAAMSFICSVMVRRPLVYSGVVVPPCLAQAEVTIALRACRHLDSGQGHGGQASLRPGWRDAPATAPRPGRPMH